MSNKTRTYPPDAVVIRRTEWGWSAYSGDNISGFYGKHDGLISSSDHLGPLVEYILTLEPTEIIIQPSQETGTCERRGRQGVLVTTVSLAEIAAEPGAPLSAEYWIAKREREAGRDRG